MFPWSTHTLDNYCISIHRDFYLLFTAIYRVCIWDFGLYIFYLSVCVYVHAFRRILNLKSNLMSMMMWPSFEHFLSDPQILFRNNLDRHFLGPSCFSKLARSGSLCHGQVSPIKSELGFIKKNGWEKDFKPRQNYGDYILKIKPCHIYNARVHRGLKVYK